MKHKGSVCDYTTERNEALKEIFRAELGKPGVCNITDVFDRIATYGAPRYYVSETQAERVLRHRRRHGSFPELATATRRAMFEDLWQRYDALCRRHPDMNNADIVYEAVNAPAPSFYLSPGTIRTIIYKTMGRGGVPVS